MAICGLRTINQKVSNIMAQILYASGDVKNVEPQNGTDFQLDELKKIVGGYIEIVYLSDKQIMVVNEEGKIRGLPRNFRVGVNFPDVIRGTVVVCGTEGEEFTDVPFDLHFWQTLLTKWKN